LTVGIAEYEEATTEPLVFRHYKGKNKEVYGWEAAVNSEAVR